MCTFVIVMNCNINLLYAEYLIREPCGVSTHKLRTTVIKSLTKMEKMDAIDINVGILLAGGKMPRK